MKITRIGKHLGGQSGHAPHPSGSPQTAHRSAQTRGNPDFFENAELVDSLGGDGNEYDSFRLGQILGAPVPEVSILSLPQTSRTRPDRPDKYNARMEFVKKGVPASMCFQEEQEECLRNHPDQALAAAALDYISGQADRHSGNWLITPNGFSLVDNGSSNSPWSARSMPTPEFLDNILLPYHSDISSLVNYVLEDNPHLTPHLKNIPLLAVSQDSSFPPSWRIRSLALHEWLSNHSYFPSRNRFPDQTQSLSEFANQIFYSVKDKSRFT